ncbi:MAG TPA: metalloregulator ArsR/SmtB family transcription factor [Ktedonobacterales bacterium]|jgi:DNA-binding transcriptional ArsR family regulator|nr:metalloregulator ArsR/SmtB family transcription factor [Ktedonobacterales bacterium]
MQDDPTRAAWHEYLDLRRALRALGDEVRLSLVRILASGDEMKVTDLAATLVISQPLVSWHLSALRRAGLVSKRRKGREVYISLDLTRYRSIVGQLSALVEPESQRQSVAEAGRSTAAPQLTPERL